MNSDKLLDALNEQMKNEFASAYLYMAIGGYFESEDLPGVALWMRAQALEEMVHGEKFHNFICETGGRTDYRGFDKPQNDFSSPLEAFEFSLNHEKFVTSGINSLMDLAKDEKNHAAQAFLQWFVTEQVEEESTFGLIVKKFARIGDDGRGLLMLDQELSQRVFTPPVQCLS